MLTICAEQEVSGILPSAPLDLVDLLFDLERLEVVELGLVRLELGMELVFTALFLWRAKKCKWCGTWSVAVLKMLEIRSLEYLQSRCARTGRLDHPYHL